MLKGIDFFCGAGGMTHGLLQAGIDVVGGVDNHLPCKPIYEDPANNRRPGGDAPSFICADVAAPEVENEIRALGIEVGDDELVFAGCSPCQYWSKVNTSRERSAKSRLLLTHFQKFVEVFNPGYVVIENVPGLNTRRPQSGLLDFLSFLKRAGYAFDENTVAAYRYGVPQKRYRYLLMATRLSAPGERPTITLPAPDDSDGRYPEPMKLKHFIGQENGFPALNAGERVDDPPLHWAAALSAANLKRIRATEHDGGNRTAWKDDPELQINAYRDRDDIFRDVYGRMRWDQPAPTITTRFHSLSNGRFGHPVEDRAISLREGAVLQTFPRTYVFSEVTAEAARQIGNAVPPELARRVGERIVDHYANLTR